jgi:putative hydrolase of the HAD superfamily
MVRAVLFDMGGTLDGDGQHWLDRFAAVYAAAGVTIDRDALRVAFDEAERRAAVDESMLAAPLESMVGRHVDWQLDHLGLPSFHRHELTARFIAPIRAAARVNVDTLRSLQERGLRLGVVSNGCGNVSVICDELGYGPFLSTVIDSRRAGVAKPDPAIFLLAAAQLDRPASSIMMVGDSFERDMLPARSIGMKTAWLEGPSPRHCPEPSAIDLRLRMLSELPLALEAGALTIA